MTNIAGTFPAPTGGNANNHQHWLSVYCGHEIQINEALQIPGSDAVKTGSMYGFANLNAKQARNYERQQQGVWHTMEIRLVGQQHTVLVDGKVINQFENAVPRVASRVGEPPTVARQFRRGYFGLQTHGGADRIFYREIRVKELDRQDIPRNLKPPRVHRDGRTLTCDSGRWAGERNSSTSGPQQPDRPRPCALPRSRPGGPRELRRSGRPAVRLLALPFRGPLKVGEGRRHFRTADDAGKLVYCQVSATEDGATVWKSAIAR